MDERQIATCYELQMAVCRLFHQPGHGGATLDRDSDLSGHMSAVLEGGNDGEAPSVPRVAGVDPATRQHLQDMVDGLRDKGLVEFVDNPAQKGSKMVALTARGVSAFEELLAKKNAILKITRKDSTPERLAASTMYLKALILTFESPQWQGIADRRTPDAEA